MGNTTTNLSHVDISHLDENVFASNNTTTTSPNSTIIINSSSTTTSSTQVINNGNKTSEELENIQIVTAKILHYMERKHSSSPPSSDSQSSSSQQSTTLLPNHILNFIVEPLSIESELNISYLDPNWKTTAKMIEIYEYLCMKFVMGQNGNGSEDVKKLVTRIKHMIIGQQQSPPSAYQQNANGSTGGVNNANLLSSPRSTHSEDTNSIGVLTSQSQSFNGVSTLNNSVDGNTTGVTSGNDHGGQQTVTTAVVVTSVETSPPSVTSPTGDVFLQPEDISSPPPVQTKKVFPRTSPRSATSPRSGQTSTSTSGNNQQKPVSPKSPRSSHTQQLDYNENAHFGEDHIVTEQIIEYEDDVPTLVKTPNSTKNGTVAQSPQAEKDSTATKLKKTLSGLRPKFKFPGKSPSTPSSTTGSSVASSPSKLSITTSKSTTNLDLLNPNNRASIRSFLQASPSSAQLSNSHGAIEDDSLYTPPQTEKKGGFLKKLGSFKRASKSFQLTSGSSDANLMASLQPPTLRRSLVKSATSIASSKDGKQEIEEGNLQFEEDDDEDLKLLKSLYNEERKQKKLFHNSLGMSIMQQYNEQEFMEYDNMDNQMGINDILTRRMIIYPEKYNCDDKSPLDNPSFIKEKIDIVSKQKNIAGDLISIKMVILDCACKQSIIKLLSPARDSIEYSKDHRRYIMAIIIGPWLLSFHEEIGLIVPTKIIPPLDNYLFDLGTLDVATNLTQLTETLSQLIIEWNTTRFYSKSHTDPVPQYLRDKAPNKKFKGANSHDFFTEFLTKLGVRINLADNPSLQHFISHVKKLGASPFVWVNEQKETIVFKTHKQLDEYVNNLSKTSSANLTLYRPLDYELLKTYDRLFWCKHFTFPLNPTYDPSMVHETTACCPFKHPLSINY